MDGDVWTETFEQTSKYLFMELMVELGIIPHTATLEVGFDDGTSFSDQVDKVRPR